MDTVRLLWRDGGQVKLRPILLIGGPVLLLAGLGAAFLLSPVESSGPEPRGEPVTVQDGWQVTDFSALEAGGAVPGWQVRAGTFQLVNVDGATLLGLQPEPMAEGNLTAGRMLASGGGIRASMRGERTRRAAPRFCVGVMGQAQFMFRAVPATGVCEIVMQQAAVTGQLQPGEKLPAVLEQVLASAPWKISPAEWQTLELLALPESPGAAEGPWRLEARIWADSAARPEAPILTHRLEASPGLLRPALHGSPFALRPIYFRSAGVSAGRAPSE